MDLSKKKQLVCYFASLRQGRMIELIYTNFVSFFFPRQARNMSRVGLMHICDSK